MAPAPLELPIGNSPSRAAVLRTWLTRTFAGRALLAGAVLKLASFLHGAVTASSRLQALDAWGDVGLVIAAGILSYRLFVDLRRRVLWRVRRKLTLSYIFIGFVPALLLVTFFLVAGVILLNNVSSHVVHTRVDELVNEAELLARTAAVSLDTADSTADAQRILERVQAAAAARHPQVSLALAPAPTVCAGGSAARPSAARTVAAGPWTHAPAPAAVPSWVTCQGHAGVVFDAHVIGREDDDAPDRLLARAVVRPAGVLAAFGVIVDLPMTHAYAAALRDETGIELLDVDAARDQPIVIGEPATGDATAANDTGQAQPARDAAGSGWQLVSPWIAVFDSTDWETGEPVPLAVGMRSNLIEVYRRITPLERLGERTTTGQILLVVLVAIGGLLLIIQLVALGMGLGLARSITGSVHELFVGTQRVQGGDWGHRIPIRSRDQLGELAQSFNRMTESMDDLLRQKAEKERLEQELRIARNIQMSLLPQGPAAIPGVALAAHCEPAREVGGDYYDYLPIDDGRVGILIADVSGKGTSAALYMAELKGIVLSLSGVHTSPRDLLIDANRIISRHLDARSFITVTYLVLDFRSRVVQYARAGHCPLIHMPGPHGPSRAARILAPDGMVVGLQIDEGETFARLLEEMTIPLGAGDLLVLYTDGITEAMSPEGDIFGDERLAALISAHPDLPSDELRERILREVRAFVGSAAQQDDMTMVLLKMEDTSVSA